MKKGINYKMSEKERKYHREWKRNAYKDPKFREKVNKQNKESDVNRKIIVSGGICWICGELNPMVFEYHHILGKDWGRNLKNRKHLNIDEDFVSLCANCHRKFRAKSAEHHVICILKAIEKGVFFI